MKNPSTGRLQTELARNWLDLPAEITANILHRLGAVEILMSAQKVCTTWYTVCKDPSIWRIIDMSNIGGSQIFSHDLKIMCKHAIDRSQGQLIDININNSGTVELLNHIIKRGCQLKRLEIWEIYESNCLGEAIKNIPSLEEISLNLTYISEKDIEIIGQNCPMLKSLKLNMNMKRFRFSYFDDNEFPNDNEAFIISKYMPQLEHLQLIGNEMTDIGLKAILDGCVQLKSLDLRFCNNLEFKGSLRKRCSEQINDLKLPNDSLEGALRHEAVYCDDSDVVVGCKYDEDDWRF